MFQCGDLDLDTKSRVADDRSPKHYAPFNAPPAPRDADTQQRLAVLSFEQVRRLNDVMDETVHIHGRGNFPTLEVRLRDLVNVVRGKLESDTASGGAGMYFVDGWMRLVEID